MVEDASHVGDEVLLRDFREIEALDAGENRRNDLLGFGRAKDEYDEGRGFFQGLEKGVEGGVGHIMDFVDDVDLVAGHDRLIGDVVDKLPHGIHRGIGGGVDFDDVRVLPFCDCPAGFTFQALMPEPFLAIECLAEKSRHCRLSRASGTAEKIGVGDLVFADSVLERRYDALLSENLVERLRTVFVI